MGIPGMLARSTAYSRLSTAPDLTTYRNTLVQVMIELADVLKRNQTYWRYWLPAAWYKWGATRVADLGFVEWFGQRLDTLRIPGGPKGAAVRSGDPLLGPFDPELERPLIQLALSGDKSAERSHLQQQLAVAMCLAFGRNPLSLRLLTEEDYRTETDDMGKSVDTLSIPLIKKRKPPRSDFLRVEIGPMLSNLIKRVIEANRCIESTVLVQNDDASNETIQMHRMLFMTDQPRSAVLYSSDRHYALSISDQGFRNLLQRFARRHKIVSPITNELIHVTPRRMRYTFATDMVDMGLSKAELAISLGHADTQSVRAYYDIGSRIVPHLEKAAAGRIEAIVGVFLPSATPCNFSPSALVTKHERLTTPVSCFLCPAFRPFQDINHASVLEVLRRDFENQPYIAKSLQSDISRAVITIDGLINALNKGDAADE